MGMDVYGMNPTTERGEYFRANVWSWRPIHWVMDNLKTGIFDEEISESMCYNDGRGLTNPNDCEEMARRIQLFIDVKMPDEATDEQHECWDPEKQVLRMDKMYSVHKSHLEEFVLFLKDCNGFEVF